MRLYFCFLLLIMASCTSTNVHRYSKVVIEPWAFIDSRFYIMQNDSLIVRDSMSHTLSFQRKLSKKELKNYDHCLTMYNLDTLPSRYDNLAMDDGNNIEIDLVNNSQSKHIWISNYYLKEIGPLVEFVNGVVPDSLDIYYPKNDEGFDYTNLETIEITK